MGCCISFNGIVLDCAANIGGIKRAWIACYDSVTKPTVTEDVISALGTPTSSFKEFEFKKQTGNVTTTITKDDANGTLFYESAIVLVFTKQETLKRVEINAIAAGDIVVIIEDNNGVFWYYGFDFPVTLTDGTAETGTNYGDFNGYNVTLTDRQLQLPYEVTASAMSGLLGTGSDN